MICGEVGNECFADEQHSYADSSKGTNRRWPCPDMKSKCSVVYDARVVENSDGTEEGGKGANEVSQEDR